MMNHEETNLHESREEMESLSLDDQSNGHSILDPPSYADAMFTSFDPQSNNGHKSSTSSSSAKSGDYLIISVTDPQVEQEISGSTTYYTYLITTQTNITEFIEPGQQHHEDSEFEFESESESEFNVRRRFKDVVTLSDRLTESYRGLLIPLRPDKNVVESQVMQKQEFVEQRRVALEKYLRKLAAHPVIRRSEELRLFLVVKGRLPLAKTVDVASRMLDGAVRLPRQLLGEEASVDVREMERPASGGRDLVRIWKEIKQYVVNDWGGTKPLVVEEDKEFLERKEKIAEFEQNLSNLSKQAESLVKAQQDIGETMGELGLAFVKLTKFETEEALLDSQKARAADMKNLATAAVKSSRFYRELNSQTVKHLDKLHEYLGIMLAVGNAFSDRTSALLTVQTLSSDLASLHSRIEKLEAASSKIFGGDRSRMRKIEELKETVRVTEDAKSCAVREYERIKENNRSELERFDKERHDDFMNMLKGFVVNQAGYAEKMANVWEVFSEETSRYAKDGS